MRNDEQRTDADFARLAGHLVELAKTDPNLPLQDGSRGPLLAWGVSALGSAREKPLASRWFRQSALWQVLRDRRTGETANQSYFLTVQWRILLSKAFLRHESARNVPKPIRDLAHYAWWALLPVVRVYDVVLADIITKAKTNYLTSPDRVLHEPFWVGIDNELDEQRFDAQSSYLLSLRWTPEDQQTGFCEAAVRWFNDHLRGAINQSEQRHYGLCAVGDHRKTDSCKTCPPTSVDRRFIGIFDGDKLANRKHWTPGDVVDDDDEVTLAPKVKLPSTGGPMDTSILNYRWILDARHRSDGVIRCKTSNGSPARLINIRELLSTWQRRGVPTIFDGHDLQSADGMSKVHGLFMNFLQVPEVPREAIPVEAKYLEAEWGDEEAFRLEEPYLITVLEASLVRNLLRMGQRDVALRKANVSRREPPKIRPARRKITLYFQAPGGTVYPVSAVRTTTTGKQKKNFYSTPEPLPVPPDRRDRVGQAIFVGEHAYWSARGLRRFAGREDYPWLAEFINWTDEQDAAFAGDSMFKEALYSENLHDRLVAIDTGERVHLGRFSAQEDQIVRDTFLGPKHSKVLSASAWQILLAKLPGRTQRGVIRRFNELGREYAFIHGYDAYTKSPYHRKFSALRRRMWLKEGCPP